MDTPLRVKQAVGIMVIIGTVLLGALSVGAFSLGKYEKVKATDGVVPRASENFLSALTNR